MLIGQWREQLFLNFALRKGQDWSSGCLATAYSIKKLFVCNKDYIEELNNYTRAKMKTRKIARRRERNFFKEWASERNLQGNLEEYENDVLDQRLSQFQLSIQKFSNFAFYVINK